jgi:hypothetical protein
MKITKYIYPRVFVFINYLGAFLIPVVVLFATQLLKESKIKIRSATLLFILFFSLFLYFVAHPKFIELSDSEALELFWYKIKRKEFPYLENVFQRIGFFPENILGGYKYPMQNGNFIFNVWGILGLFSIPATIVFLIISKKPRWLNVYFISAFLYSGLILSSPILYDRYLLSLIIVALLFLLKSMREAKIFGASKLVGAIFVPFLIFLSFLNYQFLLDYILSNKFVWDKSQELIAKEGVSPNVFRVTHSWKKTYSPQHPALYKFTYDSPEKFEESGYELKDIKKTEFPLSLFSNPTIYLYKNNMFPPT